MYRSFLFLMFLFLLGCSCEPTIPAKFEKGTIVHYKAFPEVRCLVLFNPRSEVDSWRYSLSCKNKNDNYSDIKEKYAWEWELEND